MYSNYRCINMFSISRIDLHENIDENVTSANITQQRYYTLHINNKQLLQHKVLKHIYFDLPNTV